MKIVLFVIVALVGLSIGFFDDVDRIKSSVLVVAAGLFVVLLISANFFTDTATRSFMVATASLSIWLAVALIIGHAVGATVS